MSVTLQGPRHVKVCFSLRFLRLTSDEFGGWKILTQSPTAYLRLKPGLLSLIAR